MKSSLFILLIMLSATFIQFPSYAQKKNIIVTLQDTSSIRQKVKEAFMKRDFIVKDISNTDTISTYPHGLRNYPGYIIASAVIKGNSVNINGVYSFKKIENMSYQSKSQKFHTITNGNKEQWEALQKVAALIGGEIAYSE